MIAERMERTVPLVELHFKSVTGKTDEPFFLCLRNLSFGGGFCNPFHVLCWLDEKLGFHLGIPFWCPWLVGCQKEAELDEIFALRVKLSVGIRQSKGSFLPGSNGRYVQKSGVFQYLFAVFPKRVFDGIAAQRSEIIFVEYFNSSLFHINGFYSYILIHTFHFIILCFRCQVGQHKSVHAESSIAGTVSKITSIRKVACAGLFVIRINSVVNPFPDSSADKEVGAFDGIPVVNQVSCSISHRVSVLRNVVRIFQVVFSFDRFLYPGDGRILV